MLPRLKNKTFFPGWVDDFFSNPMLPNFENRVGATMPSVNINEDTNQFNIEVAAPGMEKKDFKIDLNNNVLTVSSEHEEKSEEKGKKHLRKEFSYTSFSRSFTLPNTVKEDGIKASYTNGLLSITIPKKEEAKEKPARQIAIT